MKSGKPLLQIDLCGAWKFAFSRMPVKDEFRSAADLRSAGFHIYPATVPGNLELDLQANGLLEEPFQGMNILKLRAWDHAHVWYFRTFKADERPCFNAELLFEGLDCLGEIYLNGRHLGSTDNMLVEHAFPVDGRLAQDNELLIHLRPVLEEAGRFGYSSELYAQASNKESLYIRKAPHMYGWDIMPRALSAGLWRPVGIRYLPRERLESVFLETLAVTPDGAKADLRLNWRALISSSAVDRYAIRLEGQCGSSEFTGECQVHSAAGSFQFHIEKPELWWPKGRGPQKLYSVRACLLKNGNEIDKVKFRHGVRTVALNRTDVIDESGKGEFCFVVNGERVFIMGTNWVPLDAFHSRDIGRLDAAFALVEESGCNMIRCWGGNVYESDIFFDLCDSKGILVWQDFAMACARYPRDESFAGRIRDEVEKVVCRLRQHPSLAVWCGDNECDQACGWMAVPQDPNANILTRDVIPRVLREEDPGRPYLPSSPYISPEAFKRGESSLPENHLWGPRSNCKGDYYSKAACCFASEIGWHGCPSPESIRKFISSDRVWPFADNPEWILHGTSPVEGIHVYDYRIGLMAKQVEELFGKVPDTLELFALASQASQAEALKFFIENFRAAKWRKTGLIWWNLLDGWPQFSDAVVDYYFRKKLAFEVIRRSQQPLCLVLKEPENQWLNLVACNDCRHNLDVDFTVKDLETGGTLLSGHGIAVADSVTRFGRIPYNDGEQRFYGMEWMSAEGTGGNHYLAGAPPFDIERYLPLLRKTGVLKDKPAVCVGI